MVKPELVAGRDVSNAEKYGYAMAIETQESADAYLEELVIHRLSVSTSLTREAADKIERSNIAYWAGYGFDRERVERLFRCKHPVFGSFAENGSPSPEQAFKAGFNLARGSS